MDAFNLPWHSESFDPLKKVSRTGYGPRSAAGISIWNTAGQILLELSHFPRSAHSVICSNSARYHKLRVVFS